jgi:hypothetical protein
MTKPFLFFFFYTLTSTVFSQSTILTGDWTSKKNSNDSLTLYKGVTVSKDTESYLSQPCEFQDTILYWHFRDKNILEIEVVIRSCSVNWKQNINSDSLSTNKPSLTEYQSITISLKETRLSLWDKEIGEWAIHKDVLKITETKTFNGTYYWLSTSAHLDLIKSRHH